MSYIGVEPIPKASRVLTEGVLASSSQTISVPGGFTPNNIYVYINGSRQAQNGYDDSSGTSIDLGQVVPAGTEYVIEEIRTFLLAQQATPELAGVVEKATTTEAEAGTADKYPDAAGVHAAFKQYGLAAPVEVESGSAKSDRPAGFYQFRGTLTDLPNNFAGQAIQVARGNGGDLGEAFTLFSAQGQERLFFNQEIVGVYGDWFELYSQNSILGTVSQSAGVPTGAVIERGSNANGEWVKFADGTMICSSKVRSAYNGSRSLRGTWTFPHEFLNAPMTNSDEIYSGVSVTNPVRDDMFKYSEAWTASSIAMTFYNHQQGFLSGDYIDQMCVAHGRWF